MTVQSFKSSLRLSVRGSPGENDDDSTTTTTTNTKTPPPTKRQRIVQVPGPSPLSSSGDHHHTHTSTSSHRRSSPDLLDVTVDENDGEPSRPLSLRYTTNSNSSNLNSSIVLQPCASSSTTRRAHSHRVSPSARITPRASNNNSHNKNLDRRYHELMTTPVTPTATQLLQTSGVRESPDPLDTISPATSITASTKRKASVRNNNGSRSKSSPASVSNRSGSRMSHQRAHKERSSDGLTASVGTTDTTDVKKTTAVDKGCNLITGAAAAAATTTTTTSRFATGSDSAVTERRSLRSQDAGARSRCELASYFPNYEELLNLDPPEPEYLTGETAVKLIDDVTIPPLPSPPTTESPFGNPVSHIWEGEVITLPDSEPSEDTGDPLNEGTYFRAHRRIERQEKQLRNIERERAQHEKLQLDRILEELRSNDWLRVMGIGGIADGEKKLYEPKRNFFIKEISALVEKFRAWKEEEKRRRFDKEKMLSRVATATPDGPDEDGTQQRGGEESGRAKGTSHSDDTVLSDVASHGESADTNDVDASAAQQLHQEVKSASTARRSKVTYAQRRRQKPTKKSTDDQETEKPTETRPEATPAHPPLEKPFTSFFPKRSLRDYALSKTRRGRTRLAFGHPLPEMEEREFELPSDILTDEAIQACRRKRRRVRRENRVNEGQAN